MYWREPHRVSGLIRRLFDREGQITFAGLKREVAAAPPAPSPELLLPPEGARAFVTAVADGPDMAPVVAYAATALREHYACYDRRLEPLGAGFDWSGRKLTGHRLYALRAHRFGFLPLCTLALARAPELAPKLEATLDGWQRHGDDGGRLAYFSNLVVIQRLLACLSARAILSGLADPASARAAALADRLEEIVRVDAQFLRPRLGAAFANNHLLADRFAGWLLAAGARGLADPATCGAARAFEAELLAQTLADGCSFEHSTHYHELVSEFAVLFRAIRERNGLPLDPDVEERISGMLRFQRALAGMGPEFVDLGDCAEDPILPLNLNPHETKRALTASESTVAGGVKGQFLAAVGAAGAALEPGEADDAVRGFDSGGYVFQPRPDGLTLFRTGPAPGTQLTPGHMHSSFLSLYRQVGADILLAAPGTYSYQGAGDGWRGYFAGRRSRSALSADGWEPLAPITRNFRRNDSGLRVVTDHAACDRAAASQGTIVDAHGRAVLTRGLVDLGGGAELVFDVVPGADLLGDRQVVWQFGAAVAAVVRDGSVRARLAGRTFALSAYPAPAAVRLLRGACDPPGGWVSPAYGWKVPAPQAVFDYPATQAFMLTVIAPEGWFAGWGDCAYAPHARVLRVGFRAGGGDHVLRLVCAHGGFAVTYTRP